jgi:hypothetical protein
MLQYLAGKKEKSRADLKYFISGCHLLPTRKWIDLMMTVSHPWCEHFYQLTLSRCDSEAGRGKEESRKGAGGLNPAARRGAQAVM